MKTAGQERYIEQEGIPASAECERAILGAILLHNAAIFQAAKLRVEDFSLDSHRRIFRHMQEMSESGLAIDFQTLHEALLRGKEVESVGGISYVTSLTDGLPRVSNIEQYVNIVREKSRLRMLQNICQIVTARVNERDEVDAILGELQDGVIQIVNHGHKRTPDIKEIAREFLNELATIRRTDDACVGLSTGLDDLDELTTGFRPSEFYVFGARPGNGKTAWMCQSVRANCKAGRKCSVFSVEVQRTQIMQRLVAMESGISVFDMRDPRCLNESEMLRIQCAAAEVAQWGLFIEDSPRMDIRQLQSVARLHISKGAEVVFVDFLQKLKGPGRELFDKVTAIADGLWELARSTGVPVVALSQLKRNQDNNAEPVMEDLRQSGEIEQNAHAVLLSHRPQVVDERGNKEFTHLDKIIVAKQRSGPAGTFIPVNFNGAIGRFEKRMVSANG